MERFERTCLLFANEENEIIQEKIRSFNNTYNNK